MSLGSTISSTPKALTVRAGSIGSMYIYVYISLLAHGSAPYSSLYPEAHTTHTDALL